MGDEYNILNTAEHNYIDEPNIGNINHLGPSSFDR